MLYKVTIDSDPDRCWVIGRPDVYEAVGAVLVAMADPDVSDPPSPTSAEVQEVDTDFDQPVDIQRERKYRAEAFDMMWREPMTVMIVGLKAVRS